MTKTQGNIIIVLLLCDIAFNVLTYNVFNGFAVMNYKIEKTQALIGKEKPVEKNSAAQNKIGCPKETCLHFFVLKSGKINFPSPFQCCLRFR